jgi:hypothetical protein
MGTGGLWSLADLGNPDPITKITQLVLAVTPSLRLYFIGGLEMLQKQRGFSNVK